MALQGSYQCSGAMAKRLQGSLRISGCSSQIADMPGLGLPADAPQRPKEAGGYLPVHDLPPERDEQAIKPSELAKIQSDLTAARDRQAVASGPAKPAKKHPGEVKTP